MLVISVFQLAYNFLSSRFPSNPQVFNNDNLIVGCLKIKNSGVGEARERTRR